MLLSIAFQFSKMPGLSSILAAVLLFATWCSAQITACPIGERLVGPFNKQFLSICPGTDYYSPNINTVGNIATVDACADQCAKYPGCSKASYNAGVKTCYLKGSPTSPTWFTAPVSTLDSPSFPPSNCSDILKDACFFFLNHSQSCNC